MKPWGKSWGTYTLPDGRRVDMLRKGCKVRFFDLATGEQVGPEQANVVPAVCYAAYHGWRDDDAPAWLNDKMIAEVRATTRILP